MKPMPAPVVRSYARARSTLGALLVAALTLAARSGVAQEGPRVGFAWADQPAAARYAPNALYTYNAADGPVEITRSAPGRYAVRFARLGGGGRPGGNVQVTGYGPGPERCKVANWNSGGSDFIVNVVCFSAAGDAADARFSVLVTWDAAAGIGYAWANEAGSASYAPSATYAHNAAGGAVRVTRSGTGSYAVRFAGLGRAGAGGSVQVTAYGGGPEACAVANWNSASPDFVVNVRCFGATGTPADAQFSVLASWPARRSPGLAYVWSNRHDVASYAPSAAYAYTPAGAPLQITRSGTGAYLVRLPGSGGTTAGGNVQVTAYGGGPEHCKVDRWESGGADFVALVSCYAPSGAAADARFSLQVLGSGSGPVAACPVGGQSIDFERLPSGAAVAPEQVLLGEYRAVGVVFPLRVEAVRCGTGADCAAARSGRTVVRPGLENEFRRHPLTVEFPAPQRWVSLHAIPDGPPPEGSVATLTAYDAAGRSVAADQARPFARTDWPGPLCVAAAEASIVRVTLTLAGAGGIVTNFLMIDDLRFDGDAPAPSGDVTPPTVAIGDAEARVRTDRAEARMHLIATDETGLARIDLRVVDPTGVESVAFGASNVCGVTAACPARFDAGVTVPLVIAGVPRPGTYRVTFRACDASSNCAEAAGQIEYRAPAVEATDVWIMGVEYSQGWQDHVYTHLGRGPAQGWVPLREDGGRDTELALAVVPGKPMLVRVYVGLRGPAVDPVQVTGRIVVWRNSTEIPRTFRPLENPRCQDHLERAQPCRAVIDVYPGLGRLGLTTMTDYDLDLVRQRVDWEGTLNFVIPGDYTAEMTTGFSLDAHVDPVGRSDALGEDNAFRLSVGNVESREMNLRLVRVAMPGAPPPSRAQADRALRDVRTLLLPYSRITVVSDTVFAYGGEEALIDVNFLGIDVAEERLDQCEVLWLRLFQSFGLNRDATVLALTPRGVTLTGCGGLGWRVPELTVLREAFGRVQYLGGIALSRMPDYASTAVTSEADWGRIETLAMELHHAHLDHRHVSNDHGEADGCFLTDDALGSLVDFAAEALGFGIDVSCWKPTTHPHGTLGTYPATSVEVGVPGHVTGSLIGARVWGMLGGMGHRIEPDGSSFRLTLYDPCPTGPLDRADPLATLRLRLDPAEGYRCTLPDGDQAHDFMSYGNNRWYGIQLRPTIKNMRWAF